MAVKQAILQVYPTNHGPLLHHLNSHNIHHNSLRSEWYTTIQAKLDAVTANIEALCKVQGIKPAQATRPNLANEELFNERGERMFHEVINVRVCAHELAYKTTCWPGDLCSHIHMQTHPQVTGRRLKQSNGKPVYKCWFPVEDAQQDDAAVKRLVVKPREDDDSQVPEPESAEMTPALEKERTTSVLLPLEIEGRRREPFSTDSVYFPSAHYLHHHHHHQNGRIALVIQ